MSDPRTEDPEETGTPVPRDLPDQQAQDGEDPLDEAGGRTGDEREHETGQAPDTGQGPVPDEPSG
ncbi:hypothetical protein J7E91_33155 [Streptomyces sp. ISL-99]|uniref:hypothetical protein n=1 Tax=Streptomyces sp. ISL-99 TaxID=2819193 RepID=UPI001BEC00C2|nr:hypothetical protein [Streptomyces sp. ISL-99]MBT2530077.1 hypothetical protein [Streptomyces sp. ISL-99]